MNKVAPSRPETRLARPKGISPAKRALRRIEPYIWIAPSVILMGIFILVPILSVFQMSLSDVSKAGKIKGFNGLGNFIKVVKGSAFGLVLQNTLVWTIAVVVLSTVLGFVLALILNNQFRGRKIARAIVVFPGPPPWSSRPASGTSLSTPTTAP